MYYNTTMKIAAVFALAFNFVFTQANVVINEIHYNPSSAQGSDNYWEFIELHNAGDADADISGWEFSDALGHTFAAGSTVSAGGYLVIARSLVDGDGNAIFPGAVAWSSGNLNNTGETIVLSDAAGAVVDEVSYNDDGAVSGADGGGGSLELIDPTSDNSSMDANWQVSWVVGGTPGAANSTEPDFTVMTIYDIQYTTSLYGASDKVDQQVQVTGIVTAIDRLGFNSNFVIQDGSGAWNGIYCWWGADPVVNLGDEVTVRGTVAEYSGYGTLGDPNASMTQLTNGLIHEVLSTGNPLPAPVVLDLDQVGQEKYEGVLVTTTGRVVEEAVSQSEDPNYNYGEWRISNNLDASVNDADTINVNDRFAVTDPAFGSIATVTGPLNQWGGSSNTAPAWKIEPAAETDVTISCTNADFTVSIEMIDSYGDGWNGATYSIVGPSGGVVATGGLTSGSYAVDNVCLFEGTFSVIVGGGSYDSEISFNILNAWGNAMITGGVANLNPNPPYIPDPYYSFEVTGQNDAFGCTDATAANYDYQAGVDDGSCIYTGDVPEYPYVVTGATATVPDASIAQWFQYTVVTTGNVTVSTVGMTTNDTYLAVLANAETVEVTDENGETYVTYANIIGENDDHDYSAAIYQSELTFCAAAGDQVLIGWIPEWYDPDNPDHSQTHDFSISETPDITTPVNLGAYNWEDRIDVSWSPIPAGCAGADATRGSSMSLNSSGKAKLLSSRSGPINLVVGKRNTYKSLNPDRAQNSRSQNTSEEQIRVPYLTRDCDAGTSEITFVMAGSAYPGECSYTVTDAAGNVVATATGALTETPVAACLADGDYDVVGEDSWGDGWNGGVLTATTADGSVIFSLGMASGSTATGSFTLNSSAVYGCMDPDAVNYDAAATEDDGSCYYTGDVCSAPVVVDPAVGVTGSTAQWLSVTIPSTAGSLTYTNSGTDYTYMYTYSSCSYDLSTAEGVVGYSGFFSGGSSTSLDFSAGGTDYNGLAMDGYLGTTVLINNLYGAQVDIAWAEYVYGCTDPLASNYDPNANFDDGSCECAGLSVLMTMYDSYGDGWNGGEYAIQNSAGSTVASGTMADLAGGGTAFPDVDEICLPDDGTYSVYVADGTVAPPSSWASEISWALTSAENGQLIASGGAPFSPSGGDGVFTVPLPEYTFALYRNGTLVPGAAELTSSTYSDPLNNEDGTPNLVAGTEYCYTVTQTVGTGSPSGQSESVCSNIYVPSSCETALEITLDVINNIDGVNGRNEWFYYTPTMDGYLTVTSDLPENNPVSNDTRLYIYNGLCTAPNQIGYNDDIGGASGYLSSATVPVFEGETVYVLWDNYWSPGPSVFTASVFAPDHQPPANLAAVADHEAAHLSWAYPPDPVSNALRQAGNGNTLEQNIASITSNDMLFAQKVDANRQELYEANMNAENDEFRNTRSLEGTTIQVLGSVLNDDGTADVLLAVTVASPDVSYMDAIGLTFPDDITINSGNVDSGTMPDGTSSATCAITLSETTNSIVFGDASFLDDPATGSGWGCFNFNTHMLSVNVQAYFGEINVDYYMADDCYQSCLDMSGSLTVSEPTDVPLCYDDIFEPNDFLESPDTWTVAGTGTNDLTICPGDLDIFTVPSLGYGGWVHLNIVAEEGSEMVVSLWDLNVSDYPILSWSNDTVEVHYQNLGGVYNPYAETQIVWTVEGATGTTQFDYTGSSEVMQPEVYSYNVHAATVGTDGVVTVTETPIQDMIMGYNYTVGSLVNDVPVSFVVTTTNGDGLTSEPGAPVTVTPRADVPFAPNNLVGEPGLQSSHLSWDPPNDQRPGNLIQSAFVMDMLPFTGTGNTFGFQNNYDDCSDASESPDVVYKYTPTADVDVNISSCASIFDTKVYVYENNTQNMIACNEDGGFYDYYTCGYYTSYIDTVSFTAGNHYYIVVDGWGGDYGAYQLDVWDVASGTGEGWAIGTGETDPDLEAKALAVEENLATYEQSSDPTRSLNGYKVMRYDNDVWTEIGTTTLDVTMYLDAGLATGSDNTYKYAVKAVFDGGDSDLSNQVEVTPLAPITVPTPVNFMADANGWLIELDWQTPDLGGGESAYMENFDDGTLGTMTSASLNPAGGPTWSVGTAEDAASTYWGPPEHGTFAYYNDDAYQYEYDYTYNYIKSQVVDLTAEGLSASAISGLSAVGELYFTQPSGPCDGGGAYAEELKFHVKADDGAYENSTLVNSTSGWELVEIPLNLPENTSTVEVWFEYSDCGGTWSYGVALDDFAIMVPPMYDLLGYNVYRNNELYVPGYQQNSLIDVVNMEGDYTYGVTTVLDIYGESAPSEQTVTVTAPVASMNPPRNLTAMSMGYSADLNWAPPAGSDQWITNSNPEIGNALGSDAAFDFQVASRFSAPFLVEFQGKELREVEFMGGQNVAASNYIVQVHKAGVGGQNPVLIYESDIIPGSELEELAPNWHMIEPPIQIGAMPGTTNPNAVQVGEELWIGLRCISAGYAATYPAVVDNGPTNNGVGNLVNGFGSDGWVSLQDQFALEGNWILRGFVGWPQENFLANGSFEDWYQGDWQHFPSEFNRMGSDGQPYGNMFVDPDGAGIYGSPDGSVLDVPHEGHALKMWGMYAGGENMWGSVYQSFTAFHLGGPGAMLDLKALMMSHEHDWIGQGTNSGQIFVSYWSDYYGTTYEGAEYSMPFNGADYAASEWHEIELMAMIPEAGPTTGNPITFVNIGVQINQMNNDQHGSIYFDHFRAFPAQEMGPPPPPGREPFASRHAKRTDGEFREQGSPKLLFAENFPASEQQRTDFDFVGYKVYRGTYPDAMVALNETALLPEGMHHYFDDVGAAGTHDYQVSAVYADGNTGIPEEAKSNHVNVVLSNNAPTAVTLQAPQNGALVPLTAEMVSSGNLDIVWSQSSDADADLLEYHVTFTTNVGVIDTVYNSNILSLPYQTLYDLLVANNETVLDISWDVVVTDGWDETASSNGPWTATVDAGWLLENGAEELIPDVFALYNNYPNPFNPITNIRYDIPEVSDVRIDIYNLMGQRVRTLVSKAHQPGRYSIQWNATNDMGAAVASGMYIYKIHAKDFTSVKKLLLMK